MRFFLTVTLIFLFSISGFCQKEFTNWYFGFRSAIDFDSESPIVKFDGLMNNGTAPASISDKEGNLLFYTNGKRVWNKNHQIMPDGEGLVGNLLARQTLIVPLPGNTNQYYIFSSSSDEFNSFNSFHYSVVDMTLDNGNGNVISKNVLITDIAVGLKMTSIQHANNIDFWIVTHGVGNANFYAFLLSENGLNLNPNISTIGSEHIFGESLAHGNYETMKASHDAKKIAVISKTDVQGFNTFVEVFNFDDLTGSLSGNVIKIDGIFNDSPVSGSNGAARDIEFSPNNQLLYVTCVNSFVSIDGSRFPSSVYQFDVSLGTSSEVVSSRTELYSGRDYVGPIQKGENDKIYICTIRPELSVIQNPDALGLDCDYNHRVFSVANGPEDPRYTIALPQDIRQFFFLNIQDEPICLGSEFLFSLESSDPILGVEWNFGDGFTSTQLESSHQYQQSGTYTVTAAVQYEHGIVVRETEIIADAALNYTNEITVCDDAISDGITIFNFQHITDAIFGGQTCGLVSYHLNENDAISNLNAISDDFENTSNPQTLYIRLAEEEDPDNFIIAPVTLNVESFPILTASQLLFCPNEQGSSIDISSIIELFEGNLDCVDLNVFYTLNDAELNINNISDLIVIESPTTEIFIRLESTIISNSYIIEPLILKTVDPDLGINDAYYLCENEGELTISVPDTYDSYLWSNGDTGTSIIIYEPGSYNITVTIETYYGTCTITRNFSVLSSGIPTAASVEITDLSADNSIEISTSGIGDYEYSLDGNLFQDNPRFEDLSNSEYTVYIRDKNGCGIYSLDAFLLVQPKFFTPNGDGTNDFWQIKSSASEPSLDIEIFDRFGKSITRFNGSSRGWDGTLNGQDLPTSDYWFRVFRPSNGKTYTGHFSLKR